jgi:hypothetical protein
MNTADSQTTTVIDFRVINQLTKAPVAGAALKLMFRSFGERSEIPESATDREGRCLIQVPDPTPELLQIFVRKPGFCGWYMWLQADKSSGGFPSSFTLELPPGSTVGGVVVNEAGEPIPDVAIDLSPNLGHPRSMAPQADRDLGRSTGDKATTDSQGRWSSEIIPADLASLSIRLTHPDYVRERIMFDAANPVFKQLGEQDAKITLKKGVIVEGKVLDGRGERVADAEVAQGVRNWADTVVVRTDQEGCFTFPFQFKPGQVALCVQAAEFAPEARFVEAKAGMERIEFQLQPGQVLRVRVIDRMGRAIPGAKIVYEAPRREHAQLQHYIGFEGKTDAAGRLVWSAAPNREVYLTFFAPGQVTMRSLGLRPGPEERVITMEPAWRISGQVEDAETTEPIPYFKIVPGELRQGVLPDGQLGIMPRWSWQHAKSFRRGRYEMVFTDPLVFGSTECGDCVLRLEADGYRPITSPTYKWGEGEIAWNGKLAKAKGISGRVLSKSGVAMKDAAIIVCIGSQGPCFLNGKLDETHFSDHLHIQVDSEGRYSIKPEAQDHPVLVVHEEGFLETTLQEMAAHPEVQLPPWGAVEGTYRIGPAPAAHEPVSLSIRFSRGATFRYDTTTDGEGRFRFDRVVPGETSLALWMGEGLSGKSLRPISDSVQVRPGETAQIQVGGQGRPVIGRFVAPPGISGKIDWSAGHLALSSVSKVVPPQPPAGLGRRQREKWFEQWYKSEEYKKAQRETPFTQRFVKAKLDSDGCFRADDVAPGDYQLHYTVHESSSTGLEGGKLLQLPTHHIVLANAFTVPAAPVGGAAAPFDLGMIQFSPPIKPALGLPMHELAAVSLEGKEIQLSAYRGKPVVLAFWQADSIEHFGQRYQEFNQWQNAAVTGDRLALLCLGVDENYADAKEMFDEHKVPGWYGWLSPQQKQTLPNDYGYDYLGNFYLIGPEGTLVARSISLEDIKAALAKAGEKL